MFIISESSLETLRYIGIFFSVIGGLKLSRSVLRIGPHVFYGDMRRARGKKTVLAGIALFMLATAIDKDYTKVTWLVRTPTAEERFEQELFESAKEYGLNYDRNSKEWKEYVETSKRIYRQIK